MIGGRQGAIGALAVDTNNRQLHDNEKQRIKQLAKGNVVSEARLTAAACALVRCYAEYDVGSEAYNRLKALANAGASEALAEERAILLDHRQAGLFDYDTVGVFSDSNKDALRRLNNTYQIGTRTLGVGVGLAGTAATVGIVLTAPASCATGVGCAASVVGGGLSIDAAATGFAQAISGESENTITNQALQSLGLSPEAALYTEFALSLAAPAKALQVATRNALPVAVVQEVGSAGRGFANNIPNKRASELLSDPAFAKRVNDVDCTDCDDLARMFFKASGDKGSILDFTTPSGAIRVKEFGRVEDFVDHRVFSDGKFIFDPRFSSKPVPVKQFIDELKQLNPELVIKDVTP